MKKKDLIERLKLLADINGDVEQTHQAADKMLLDYINDPEVTETFNDINKWYA